MSTNLLPGLTEVPALPGVSGAAAMNALVWVWQDLLAGEAELELLELAAWGGIEASVGQAPRPPGLRQWCEHLLQLRRRRLADYAGGVVEELLAAWRQADVWAEVSIEACDVPCPPPPRNQWRATVLLLTDGANMLQRRAQLMCWPHLGYRQGENFETSLGAKRRRRLEAQALMELYTEVLEPSITEAGLRWDWDGNVRHNPWVEGIEVVLPLREGHGEAEQD
ncbi:hypothetical protein EII12_05895 [Buchananella hordeovulneris]|uniref:hypothetical protein n=1 Tax=Buchananella hordeovulneris TaxID=52770 RepID=UPI000F5E7762|nr:hypothetical protein [Buchananella hordeovulneris]RRD52162.1 hypothetical protein EII12_05895 [Buchananella hordeovulneris]